MMITAETIETMTRIYLATTNPGKLRELREAAQPCKLEVEPLPALAELPPAIEDGKTFEENARIKAEYYSRHAHGEVVLAEDSGLEVDELGGAPGVYSARYAAVLAHGVAGHENSDDQANNQALIAQLERFQAGPHAGRYVCVIALAKDGRTLETFRGKAEGELITTPRGTGGFGYDPLFYFPILEKTFAELPLAEKRRHSHRGEAFRRFLEWYMDKAKSPGFFQ
ncbi:MAG TPA: RdgB/HAM1 family non-canonical purine NTP pyrophosphatase [Candidatus Angelobacter sp.]|jgi:XTP/dITP diphosphohydrolase|nr:RdgB/HAM1 family non-canonical purine NTP pyrophosphatase [Candidatus Angelobacter sp.]